METKQALQIVQNVLNAAVQKGLFVSMDDVAAANIALKTIEQALTPTLTEDAKKILSEEVVVATNGKI